MSKKTVGILISGKVQGVFFRKFTCEAASKFEIKGTVRNQPDGCVYVEATGDSEQLDKFIKWCYRGSPYSNVEKVEVTDLPYQQFTRFDIRY